MQKEQNAKRNCPVVLRDSPSLPRGRIPFANGLLHYENIGCGKLVPFMESKNSLFSVPFWADEMPGSGGKLVYAASMPFSLVKLGDAYVPSNPSKTGVFTVLVSFDAPGGMAPSFFVPVEFMPLQGTSLH